MGCLSFMEGSNWTIPNSEHCKRKAVDKKKKKSIYLPSTSTFIYVFIILYIIFSFFLG